MWMSSILFSANSLVSGPTLTGRGEGGGETRPGVCAVTPEAPRMAAGVEDWFWIQTDKHDGF